MTLVNIDIKNVASETHPDDRVVFYSPTLREAPGGGITSTAETVVPLVDGVGEIELVPGPVTVTFQCRGMADTRPKRGTVPETGPVTVADVIGDSFVYTPEVVGAAQAASNEAIQASALAKNFRDETFTYSRDAADGAEVATVKAADAESAAWRAEMAIGQVKVTESPPGSGLWSFNSAVLDVEETAPDSGLYTIEVAYA